jgi:hypothetical protein
LFLLLSVLSVTYSSIGIHTLREHPKDPEGVMLGEARSIRSDEFLTGTPALIGVTATGNTDDWNPLTAPQEILSTLPSGPVSSILLPESALLRLGPWLPDSMLVAARLWAPFLLLALSVPSWFRRMTGNRRIGLVALFLLVVSPLSAWWSFIPISVLGPTFAGAVCLILATEAARERSTPRLLGWGLLSAILLAKTAWTYQPWAVIIVPAVVMATVALLVAPPRTRRRSATVVAGIGAATLAFVAITVLESRETISAVTSTVYPGSRVSTGMPNPLQELFGATSLQVLTRDPQLIGTNASEISSSYAIALLWCVLLLAYQPLARPRHRWPVAVLGVLTSLWLAWSTVSFGRVGEAIPLINQVPSARAADVLGMLAIVLLCLLLPRLPRRTGLLFAALCGTATGALAAYAGSLLRTQNVPALSLTAIWVSSALVGLAVFAITFRPHSWPGYALAALGCLALVWNVNPVLIGLGDLRGSRVADTMLAVGDRARSDGDLWVSDSASTDTLFVATGVPALSGRQIAGPDTAIWSRLDPGHLHEDVWNRGGSFIWFQWTEDQELTFSNPSPDVILITGSPCTLAESMPDLTTVVATADLELPCVDQTETFRWGEQKRWVFKVRA